MASAKVLLDVGDSEGAYNRAYYAMFHATRATLLASGAVKARALKTFAKIKANPNGKANP